MTQPEYRSPLSSVGSIGTYAVPGMVALAGLVLGTVGCDTVAKISFPERGVSSVESTGLIAAPSSCQNPGSNGGIANLRFVVVDDETPKSPFTADDVTIAPDDVQMQAGSIAEAPDMSCAGPNGVKCDLQQYKCSSIGGTQASQKRCVQKSQQYNVDDVRFVSDTDDPQLFGVVMENGWSVRGLFPDVIKNNYYDANGDGKAEKKGTAFITPVATDPDGKAKAKLSNVANAWSDVAQAAQSKRNIRTFFGFWTMNGIGQTNSIVKQSSDAGEVWTRFDDEVSDATTTAVPDATNGRVQPLTAVSNVLDEGFAGQNFEGYDKTLVVIVDGPPDYPASYDQNVSVESVIQKAKSLGVKLQVLQLDPAIEANQLRDDPVFYENQGDPCSSDADCADWQTCRDVNGYSPSQGGDVSSGRHRKGTFCMPDYRSDGRIGPLEMYYRLACATGGGYQYLRSAEDFDWAMPWLPYTMDGVWEAEVEVIPFAQGRVESGAPHRLSTSVSVTTNRATNSFQLSQTAEGDPNAIDAGDTRSVIFAGDDSN